MKKNLHWWLNGLLLCTVISVFASCASTRHVPYFEDVPDSTKLTIKAAAAFTDPVILTDDILSYSIITIDPATSAPVNQAANIAVPSSTVSSSGSSASSSANTLVPGLLVDKNGEISIPILGTIKVAGLTTFEAKAVIKKRAEIYFKEPDVQLRFANFKISVLGEVTRPAVYVMPNEKVTILDALSLAGDLTIFGRREDVLVIRDVDGQKQMARLNLDNSTELFKSPYFYLRQNDVVYVEPNKSAIVQADAQQTRIVTIAAAIVTSALILLIRTSK